MLTQWRFVHSFSLLAILCLLVKANVKGDSEGEKNRVAVATLVTTSAYVAGAEVLAESLDRVNAIGDRILLFVGPDDDPRSDLTEEHLRDLRHAGWKTIQLTQKDKTFTPCAVSEQQKLQIQSDPRITSISRYWGTCSKFAVWTLINYDAVFYIDADSIVLNNFDTLYDNILDGTENGLLYAHGTPPCWDDPPVCEKFYSAVLLLKPLSHLHDYMKRIAEKNTSPYGDIDLLNALWKSWKHLPKYTLVAQTDTVRPLVATGLNEVDWSLVKVYDFAGPPMAKPWFTYHLQRKLGNKYAHEYLKTDDPESKIFYYYLYPQWIWNDYYDAVLERKRSLSPLHIEL